MATSILIQGKTYTIKDIASAKTALAAAKTPDDVLGVLGISNNPTHVSNGAFTVDELTSKATSLSTKISGAEQMLVCPKRNIILGSTIIKASMKPGIFRKRVSGLIRRQTKD